MNLVMWENTSSFRAEGFKSKWSGRVWLELTLSGTHLRLRTTTSLNISCFPSWTWFAFVITSKDICYYDLVLNAQPEHLNASWMLNLTLTDESYVIVGFVFTTINKTEKNKNKKQNWIMIFFDHIHSTYTTYNLPTFNHWYRATVPSAQYLLCLLLFVSFVIRLKYK